MVDIPVFTLNNGTRMPGVGLGCWMGEPGEEERAYNMCKKAIAIGYRHFDTAAGYGNEEAVGRAIRDSGIPREEFFITTKLINSPDTSVNEAFNKGFSDLNCEYIDSYLMHWPQAMGENGTLPPDQSPTFVECWQNMEKLMDTGKVKSIGVSNFSIKNLEILLPQCSIVPAVNQVESHPCLPQHELKAYCEAKGILMTAWAAIGRPGWHTTLPNILEEPTFKAIADKHNAEVVQVLLSWAVQRGTPAFPKTENEARMKTNISLITLDEDEMDVLDNFHKKPGMHTSLAGSSLHKPDGTVFGWEYRHLGWNMTIGGLVVSE
ncbi:hypothetical protein D9758_008438 [Tetrapyrgos nigripes]|uniref:NADP-dependent oxidoreductase domain-containing protein n=1 Tax=Tetrapyrgos nigripes TaxID=182062 RepID=A0A8H5FQT2_9AGAR|nr:hypothetical protein D9758_008438 [Tetrapyrgos nigripes]